MVYKIQANPTGTRHIEVTDEHLQTIRHYQLLRNLVDSSGIIDENVLDKLKFTVRSLLEASVVPSTEETADNELNADGITQEPADATSNKALLDLCLDVIYNSNMKAFGLHQLTLLYIDWSEKN
ncbi:MAG: hypothetical protein IJV36_06370 [Prevotella sp.]|nr:hypothetical protein [Prevotella sp.]